MKNLAILLILSFLTFSFNLTAETTTSEIESTACTWKSWFKYPKNNGSYEVGKSVYVRVDPQKYQDIEYMELSINGKLIRKESQYPYEWAKGNSGDNYLRRLRPGTYKLKCKIKDRCGKFHEIYCTFYVKGNGNQQGGQCAYKAWFKYPENGKSYQVGSSVYVKVDAQNYKNIKYCELYVNGKLVRKESSYPYEWAKGNGNNDGYLRKLKAGTYKLQCRVYDNCGKYKDYYSTFYVKGGGHDQDGQCAYKAWFKYPQNGKYYNAGSSVYVYVDAQNYKYIKHTELYVNGKLVRKENTYPYEWAKGQGSGDGYLRNLKPGTYKLQCRVYDTCGKYKDYYSTFYVKGGGQVGGVETCKYKSWFKYPKNNGTYRYGSDVYVRVDTEKYQDIQEMHLYVNNKLVRKETQYPYEWAKGSGNGDSYLRNLKRGTYNLKCRVKTKCGQWYEYFAKFYVR